MPDRTTSPPAAPGRRTGRSATAPPGRPEAATRTGNGSACPRAAGAAPPALAVDALTWQVGGRRILDAVSFEAAAGEFLAVIGPNGAGKTSLFNLITGLTRPTAGTIALGGAEVGSLPAHRRVRHGLGRTFQASSLFPAMTVLENVELAAQAAVSGPYGSLRPWARIGRRATERAATALDRARLAGRAGAAAGSLSHGEKRKLELALLLTGDPRVILLDEPMAGMAMEEVPELTEVIREVHREGAAVLMVEHHMDVVMGLAERIAVLHHGVLLACGTPAAITEDPAVREAYLGEPL